MWKHKLALAPACSTRGKTGLDLFVQATTSFLLCGHWRVESQASKEIPTKAVRNNYVEEPGIHRQVHLACDPLVNPVPNRFVYCVHPAWPRALQILNPICKPPQFRLPVEIPFRKTKFFPVQSSRTWSQKRKMPRHQVMQWWPLVRSQSCDLNDDGGLFLSVYQPRPRSLKCLCDRGNSRHHGFTLSVSHSIRSPTRLPVVLCNRNFPSWSKWIPLTGSGMSVHNSMSSMMMHCL